MQLIKKRPHPFSPVRKAKLASISIAFACSLHFSGALLADSNPISPILKKISHPISTEFANGHEERANAIAMKVWANLMMALNNRFYEPTQTYSFASSTPQ